MNKQLPLSFRQLFSTSILVFTLFLIATFISAWTGATANPPGNNVATPLNTGSTGQIKQGGLVLNASGGATNGLIVHAGKVGIGTDDPQHTLDVNGNAYFDQNVGIGISNPAQKLVVNGTAVLVNGSLRLSNGGETCGPSGAGLMRYNSSTNIVEYCNGTAWQALSTTTAASPPAVCSPQTATYATAGSYTWTKPSAPGCTVVTMECWGGGGGGSASGGGGGGAYARQVLPLAALPASIGVTVGSGGVGGYYSFINNEPGSGGASSVGNYVIADGGGPYEMGGTGSVGVVERGGNGGGGGYTGDPLAESRSCAGGGGGAGYSSTPGGTSGCGGNGGTGSFTGGGAGSAPGGGGGYGSFGFNMS